MAAIEPTRKVSKVVLDACSTETLRSTRLCEWQTALFGSSETTVRVCYLVGVGLALAVLGIIFWHRTHPERPAHLS